MSTDHYAEAEYLMGALDTVDQSDLERRPTIYHFDLARAQVLATLALTDAVRALKAGATVTTTHVEAATADVIAELKAAVENRCGARCRCAQSRSCGKPKGHDGPHATHWPTQERAEEAPRG